jgi:NADH:ubiquinone oxidoreductase subunit F (NADH-binding)
VRIKCGAGAFVCGEETALIRSIEGKRGMPVPRPPFPTTSGLHGKPTVINNVETLATIPVLLGLGVSFFRKFGSEKSKGTKVFALSGHIERSGLVEVEIGTTVKEVIFDIGGGIPQGRRFKAVQFGGPSGGCVPDRFLELPIDYETLQEAGAMMGSGGMVVMDERTCMVDLAKYFMQFIQRESCGKCIPCREGTKQLLSILESLTQNRASESGVDSLRRFKAVTRMEALSEVIRDTSLCGLGKSAPNPVLSTLTWFREEYEAHVFDRHCAAGTCRDLVQLRIDPDKCRGCTLCARQCPTHAISGGKREAHHIDLNACINCFHCQEICKFDAIVALA